MKKRIESLQLFPRFASSITTRFREKLMKKRIERSLILKEMLYLDLQFQRKAHEKED